MARRVFLVGFMGCGKSSFGRRLASELRWRWVDTDREIERRAGRTIAEIFEQSGEEAFRALEEEVVGEARSSADNVVVSLGGGAVCRQGAMERLVESGETIYLNMPVDRLIRRLSPVGRAKRPKIAGMGDAELRSYIEKTLPERENFYKRANFVLECGDGSDDTVLRALMQHIDNLYVK